MLIGELAKASGVSARTKKLSIRAKLAILEEKLVTIDARIKHLHEIKSLIAEFKKDLRRNNC